MKKTMKSITALLWVCLLAGRVSSSPSVLCVAPQGQFSPKTEDEVLAELNSQLPITIPHKHFIARKTSKGLIGWAQVGSSQQVNVVKETLKDSVTLKLLQVEALTPECEALIKQHRQ